MPISDTPEARHISGDRGHPVRFVDRFGWWSYAAWLHQPWGWVVAGSETYGSGLSSGWSEEHRRLAGAEALFDAATFRHLETVGLKAGMRCLEVGGGAGSVGRFMAERVGSTGQVTITDLDTGLLRGCDAANIEVLVHDITTDPLEVSAFDVIHARTVLEHLPNRLDVLGKLVAALRPGGWLLVEDVDQHDYMHTPQFLFAQPEPIAEIYRDSGPAGRPILEASDFDDQFGRDLPGHLVAASLVDVDAEYRTPLIRGGTLGAEWYALSVRVFRPALVARGFAGESIDTLIAGLQEPNTMLRSPVTMVSAWGQRSP
jgi:SAM-dependent methyltransferase